jgi:hypothetical protein
MGIRKSAQTERQGCRGMWPLGSPNDANVRSKRRHIPLYVGICVRYSGPLRSTADMEVGAYVERKLKIETARVWLELTLDGGEDVSR